MSFEAIIFHKEGKGKMTRQNPIAKPFSTG
jgi:hypothetical protein